MANEFTYFLSLVHFRTLGWFLVWQIFKLILTLVFLKFMFQIISISLIFFIVIVKISIFEGFVLIWWIILWENIFECLLIVLTFNLMVLPILFWVPIILFIGLKLVTDPKYRMNLSFWLFLRIIPFFYFFTIIMNISNISPFHLLYFVCILLLLLFLSLLLCFISLLLVLLLLLFLLLLLLIFFTILLQSFFDKRHEKLNHIANTVFIPTNNISPFNFKKISFNDILLCH